MKQLVLLFFLLLAESWCNSVSDIINVDGKPIDWWQKAVFYQIYPRSFYDADNDGIGDLKGIIQKMDHLVDTGADAIWLSPIYQSPMVDGGYDISDYRAIAPEYGTLDDFKQFVKLSHENGLKVILDFVPNHTSDEHEWFNKSVNRVEGYEDYYFWADAKHNENGDRVPPNNWISVWRNSGWTWNNQRQQYYFHQFSDRQPDLNYRNVKVVEEMKDVLKYWLDLGVDGFRIDAVPHIFEDSQLRDEPVDPNSGVTDPNSYSYLKHIYTKDQPETFDLVYSWRSFIDNYTQTVGGDTRAFMTECATDLETVVRYYGNEDGSVLGAHFSFNFDLLGMTEKNRPVDIKNILNNWQNTLPSLYTLNWLTGNHDNHRVGSRVGKINIDGYNMIIFFLPGITITYMGEEIGQEDGEVTCEQGQDPSAIGNCTTFNDTSRDFERTPFQWDDSVNAGFNEGNATWLPVGKTYKETNLATQLRENRSHYHIYQELIDIKSQLVLTDDLRLDESDPDVLQITRTISEQKTDFTLVFNMGVENKSVSVQQIVGGTYVVLSSSVNSDYFPGDVVANVNVNLKPGDSIIFKKI